MSQNSPPATKINMKEVRYFSLVSITTATITNTSAMIIAMTLPIIIGIETCGLSLNRSITKSEIGIL